jgi:hypothetical protein
MVEVPFGAETVDAMENSPEPLRLRFDLVAHLVGFTTEMSCLTIVWAVMQDLRFHKIAVS